MPTRKAGDIKYYERLAKIAQRITAAEAEQYRESDSRIDDPAHTDLGNALTRLCRSLRRPLTVLDLGCGCGRHFRFLEGADRIVGVDASTEMLKQAEHPAGEEMISGNIELICGNFLTLEFPDQSFDLIYSCGVLGAWVSLDDYLLRKISRWLKLGGAVLLVVVDAKSPDSQTFKVKVALALRRFMPAPIKRWMDARHGWPFLKLYESELKDLMDNAGFTYSIWHRGDPKRRVDLVCEAQKLSQVLRDK